MKTKSTLVSIALLTLLQACSSLSETSTNPEEGVFATTESAVPQPFEMKGTLVLGPDSRTFTPCGSREQYLLQTKPEILKELTNLQTETYQPLYSEFSGHLLPMPQTAPEQDFGAQFIASELKYASTKSLEKKCINRSDVDTSLDWVGTYSATSTKSGGFSVSMALTQDHSASITYQSGTGGAETKEKGFWQQINSQQVQVIMTRHQGQRLLSNRLFTVVDEKLIAVEEIINGTTYPIADGGLVLYPEKSSR
ncbi:hypothetical protein [Vibrio sp. HN007]|uniref:hypothetical protein n=1 Tax=Vibrio iocasae TaxID=3098914 RepID=UPI0035D4376C